FKKFEGLVRGHHAVLPRPAEAVLGTGARSIFGADPALVPEFVHGLEYGRVVDLALIRLVPGWHRCALQVSNQGKESLEAVDQIAADDLYVIEIELHADIGLRGFFNDGSGVLDMIEKIVGPVPTVDRLDQQLDFLCGSKIGGVHQIVEKDAIGGRTLLGRNLAGEVERTREHCLPLLLTSRYGGEPEFAFAPRWRIEAKNGQPISFDGRFHGVGRYVVRKLQLDGPEASRRRRIDPFEQRSFREKIAEIGSKTWHWATLDEPLRAEARAYSLAPRPTQDHLENRCPPIQLSILPCCRETVLVPKSWSRHSRSCAGSRRARRAWPSVSPRVRRELGTIARLANRCRIQPSSFARVPTPSCWAPAVFRPCAIPTIPRSCRRSNCVSFSISMPACDRPVSSPAYRVRSLMRTRVASISY